VPPKTHSVLAPSSKEWTHCGFSAKFLATKEDETNEMSEFGSECQDIVNQHLVHIQFVKTEVLRGCRV